MCSRCISAAFLSGAANAVAKRFRLEGRGLTIGGYADADDDSGSYDADAGAVDAGSYDEYADAGAVDGSYDDEYADAGAVDGSYDDEYADAGAVDAGLCNDGAWHADE